MLFAPLYLEDPDYNRIDLNKVEQSLYQSSI